MNTVPADVRRLINRGYSTEQIAVELKVSNNTVIRWRDGKAEPHRGHREALTELVKKASVQKKSA